MSNNNLKWGILGTGYIAHVIAETILNTPNNALVAIASRQMNSAEKFAHKFNINKTYESYERLLKDTDVDIVYIALPNTLHEEWIIKSAENRKHILCEKPFTLNLQEAKKALAAVNKAEVFCMEAFMYRFHPQTSKIISLLNSKKFGEIKFIDSSFAWNSTTELNANNDYILGGGSINSLGSYCLSFSRLIAGINQNNSFSNPLDLFATANFGKRKIEESTTATMQFSNNCFANMHVSLEYGFESNLYIVTKNGSLRITNPWLPKENSKIETYFYETNETKVITIDSKLSSYHHEIIAVNNAIAKGQIQMSYPGISWDDTIGNMDALSKWRNAVGIKY